jgi:hypothetical protein
MQRRARVCDRGPAAAGRRPWGVPGDVYVADIFNEVDEEVRRERLQRMWEQYGAYAIAALILLVAGVAAWRGYEYWQARKAAEAGAAFQNAVVLSQDGKHDEAEAAFAKLAGEGTAGYRTLARFREAAELGQKDTGAAVKAYDALAADGSIGRTMQDLAAVRAGLLLVDSSPLDEMTRRLEPATAPDRSFRHTARELLALSAWRTGDVAQARKWTELMRNDIETPAGAKNLVDILTALMPAEAKS